MNFYKRYPGDYMRDTSDLSLAQHGAYTLLLDHYYSTGKLPASLESLCRICRAMNEDEQTAVKAIAEAFFPLDANGCRHNHRADEERAVWQLKAEANREAGKRGGRPKVVLNGAQYDIPDLTQTLTQVLTETLTQTVSEQEPTDNPLQKPDTRYQKSETKPKRGRGSAPRSRRAPNDFVLSETRRAWAEKNAPDIDVDGQFAMFLDHEFAEPHSDWDAAWRNWCRRSARFTQPTGKRRVRAKSADELEAEEQRK